MIDVFISRPTKISAKYESSYSEFEIFLKEKGIKSRRLGGSDYSRKAPLIAVMEIIEDCKGAIIIGFPQFEFRNSSKKADDILNESSMLFPTPWNQIEAVLAYKERIPVLVIAQNEIEGGIFDYGITGEFVLKTDLSNKDWHKGKAFSGIFDDWYSDIKV